MKSTLQYFTWSFIVTVFGLAGAGVLGWYYGGVEGLMTFLMIGAVLSVLEISLSFDNAIVNANVLKGMEPVWQRRFLTWGILIAVFGMRIIFPLLIVVIAANIGPWQALVLAASQPEEYSRIMHDAHLPIAAFGGAFLMMVGLSFFIDDEKDVNWIPGVESFLAKAGGIQGFSIAIVLAVMMVFCSLLPSENVETFLYSGVAGLLTYLAVDVIGHVLDADDEATDIAAKGGFGAFLYLEVLDASFSFDGVIGAFALTHNLFLIAIGLGIGAMYVRSMTIMLVERATLQQFRYLEHGAFWSILSLSVIMFVQTMYHIPEVITGLFGATMIGLGLWSSIRWNKANPEAEVAAAPAE